MSLRARTRGGPAVLSPNLTPLLDVVLQLITFFLMLVHFGTKVEGDAQTVRLPVTASAMPTDDLAMDRLVLGMDSTGRLLVEGEEVPLGEPEAAGFWAAQAKARRKGLATLRALNPGPADLLPTVVVIRADREVAYGSVRKALVTAQEQGFAQFSLIVKQRPGP